MSKVESQKRHSVIPLKPQTDLVVANCWLDEGGNQRTAFLNIVIQPNISKGTLDL